MDLQAATIWRGGAKSRYFSDHTFECSFAIARQTNPPRQNVLRFDFEISSKGGGSTALRLEIGIEDVPVILEAIARNMPDTAGALADSAAIASDLNLQRLAEAQKLKDNEKTWAQGLVQNLESVGEYVTEKYNDAPVGQDEREAEVRDRLEEVLGSLRLKT